MPAWAYDAIVVGAGPNGLAAAITLARTGRSVVVFEGAEAAGGGVRSGALTMPGFVHDVCSSVYPMGVASPFFRSLPLESLGVRWVQPVLPLAHPLEDGSAASLSRSIDETAADLGPDGPAYARLFAPFSDHWKALLEDVLAPPHLPRHPWLLARFARSGLSPASRLAVHRFRGERAQALLAGLAAHSVLPLDAPLSSAVALLLGALAHAVGWPFVRGGAGRLAEGLVSYLTSLGGEMVTGRPVLTLAELPPARVVLCDVGARQLSALAGAPLSKGYRAALARYRYGPGVFKIDWALAQPIPWHAPECAHAGTVHVGGRLTEIAASESAVWCGIAPTRPFVIVTQPTICDPTRAPEGRHVAWGYCHVPHASTVDMTDRIEQQIERFATGFRDLILARRVAAPADLEGRNPNLVGGDIGGGVLDLHQALARPTLRTYRTPLPGLYLCSSSTPPGGGVHGMCGYYAAQAALRRWNR